MSETSVYDKIMKMAEAATEFEFTRATPETPYNETIWKNIIVSYIYTKDKAWVDTAVTSLVYSILSKAPATQILTISTALASQLKDPIDISKLVINNDSLKNFARQVDIDAT